VTAEAIHRRRESDDTAEVRRFGAFEMDLRSGELRKSGVPVRLQPQPFRLLALLTDRPGEVLTRERIREELWPDGTFVDFEQSVNFCVRQIRLALNDSATTPRFVETLPRRGYRWVGGPMEGATGSAARPVAGSPPGAGRGWRRRGLAVAASVAGVLLVALFLRYGTGRSPLGESPAVQFHRLTFRRGFVTSARFGPDGQVIYVASWDGQPLTLHEARPDSPDARSLGLQAAELAGLSASGEVAYIHDGVLARAPLAGGPPREVATGVRAADWTADRSTFALARALEDGYRVEYPVGHVIGEVPNLSDLRISPDGRHLTFVQHPTLRDDRGFVVIMDASGKRIATSETFGSLDGLAWSPGGDEVWFTGVTVGVENSLRALALDGGERTILGSMGRLVLYDVAPDGRALIGRASIRAEILFQRRGEPDPVDLSWLDVSAVAALSDDGDTILFYEGGEGGGPDYTTYLRRTDGSAPVRLGRGWAFDLSPDGRSALVIPVSRPDHVTLMPTGAGPTREIRSPGELVSYDAAGWLPDGERLFVTGRSAAGKSSTWIVGRRGENPHRLPLPPGRVVVNNTFSSDGRSVVADCPLPDERPCVYDVRQGNPRPVSGAQTGWTCVGWDDRGGIFFRDSSPISHPVKLHRVDPATGAAEVVAELRPRDPSGYFTVYRVFVTPDGSAWAYTVLRRQADLFVTTGLE
jgi:DNA-binding winged helix-turn-helix (wHTH) protein